MPDAEHGTSARMRSNGTPSHQAAGCAASRDLHRRAQARVAQVCARCARSARRIDIERGQLDVGTLQHVRRSCRPAPRRRRARAGRPADRGNSAARCAPASCTDTSPRRTRQPLHRHRPLEQQRFVAAAARGMPAACEPRCDSRATSPRRRFTRRHIGGCALPAREHRLPVARVGVAQRIDPPARMLVARLSVARERALRSRRARAGSRAAAR